MSFSERSLQKILEMKPSTRIGLWNVFLARIFGKITMQRSGMVGEDFYIFLVLWKQFYKNPMDEYERDVGERKAWYRDQFEALEPAKVLDLLEFVVQKLIPQDSKPFADDANAVFEDEHVPLRFVNQRILPLHWTESAVVADDLQERTRFYGLTEIEQAQVHLTSCFKEPDANKNKLKEEMLAFFEKTELYFKSMSIQLDDALKQLTQQAISKVEDDADREFAYNLVNASLRSLFQKAEAAGHLKAFERIYFKVHRADPWGERK